MRAGRLRHRVAIQELTRSKKWGQQKTWITIATVWAAIEPFRGREFYDGNANNNYITHRVKMRYMPGITAKHRILYKNRVFNIEKIYDMDERNRDFEIEAIEENGMRQVNRG